MEQKQPVQSPRRVVVVTHEVHDRGGMERVTLHVLQHLAQRYDFVVLSRELHPSLRELVTWRHVRVPARPFPLRYVLFWLKAGWILRREVGLRHTLGAVVPNRVDLATVHFLHGAYRPPSGNRPVLRRVNTTLTRALSLVAERWCYRASRLRMLAAVSSGVEEECTRLFPSVPVVVTPNGVDASRFRPNAEARSQVRAELGISDDHPVALFVGGDWARKGLAIAVAAVQSLGDGELWVAGGGSPAEIPEAEPDRVRLLGRRDDVERLYAAADVFVLPSAYEADPLVIYEAASSGIPVVVTDVNGARGLVGRSGCGSIVARDPGAVASALTRLFASPELRRQQGAAGRAVALASSWEATALTTSAVYDGLLAESPTA